MERLMSKEKSLLILICTFLSACSANGVKYNELQVSSLQGQSRIVIYRASKMGASGSTFCTKVNGESIGVLQNGGFLRTMVNPGSHNISMPFDESLSIEIEAKPDEVSYVEFTIGLAGMDVLPVSTITAVSMSWNMALIFTSPDYSLTKLTSLKESKYSDTCTK